MDGWICCRCRFYDPPAWRCVKHFVTIGPSESCVDWQWNEKENAEQETPDEPQEQEPQV